MAKLDEALNNLAEDVKFEVINSFPLESSMKGRLMFCRILL